MRGQDAAAVAALTSANQALSGAAAPTAVVITGSVTRSVGPDQDGGAAVLSAAAGIGGKVVMHLSQGDLTESQLPRRGYRWAGDAVVHKVPRHNLQASVQWFFPAMLVNEWLTDAKLVTTNIGADQRDGVAVQHIQCKRTFLTESDANQRATRTGRRHGSLSG